MTSVWGKVSPVATVSLADVMSEQLADRLIRADADPLSARSADVSIGSPAVLASGSVTDSRCTCRQEIPGGVTQRTELENPPGSVSPGAGLEESPGGSCDVSSDMLLAAMLQEQFDREYDHFVCVQERKHNGMSKVAVSFRNYRVGSDLHLFHSSSSSASSCSDEEVEDEEEDDAGMSGESCSTRGCLVGRTRRVRDSSDVATAGGTLDAAARLTLLRLINADVLQRVEGVISCGKEAVVLRAVGGGAADRRGHAIPPLCAVKVYKTTLAGFRTRDRYIRHDRRFDSGRASAGGEGIRGKHPGRGGTRRLVALWAEKELRNLRRMARAGIRCPRAVLLKNHVLVMSLITDSESGRAPGEAPVAPQLRHCSLRPSQWLAVFLQLVDMLRVLYRRCRLVHADLSEYNVLYTDGACWLIDVGQSVELRHPLALTLLHRDCTNLTRFFRHRLAASTPETHLHLLSPETLFTEVSGLPLTAAGETDSGGIEQQLTLLQRQVTESFDGLSARSGDAEVIESIDELSVRSGDPEVTENRDGLATRSGESDDHSERLDTVCPS